MADPLVDAGGLTVYTDRQLVVTRTEMPDGLRFLGEIDLSNSTAIARSLIPLLSMNANPHLDMTDLIFCDVSGIRALVTVAQNLGPDRRLRLHGLEPQIERVIRVIGWSGDSGGLGFCAGGDCQ